MIKVIIRKKNRQISYTVLQGTVMSWVIDTCILGSLVRNLAQDDSLFLPFME